MAAFDANVDVKPATGSRVAPGAPADFTWLTVTEDGAPFTRNPAMRAGFTYNASARRLRPAHRATGRHARAADHA